MAASRGPDGSARSAACLPDPVPARPPALRPFDAMTLGSSGQGRSAGRASASSATNGDGGPDVVMVTDRRPRVTPTWKMRRSSSVSSARLWGWRSPRTSWTMTWGHSRPLVVWIVARGHRRGRIGGVVGGDGGQLGTEPVGEGGRIGVEIGHRQQGGQLVGVGRPPDRPLRRVELGRGTEQADVVVDRFEELVGRGLAGAVRLVDQGHGGGRCRRRRRRRCRRHARC